MASNYIGFIINILKSNKPGDQPKARRHEISKSAPIRALGTI